MALVALVIGTAVAASATERVTLSLVLTGAIGWAFVPVLQLLTGLVLVGRAGGDRVWLLDRYFATGWPWLMWILAAHAAVVVIPISRNLGLWMVATAAVPVLWTGRLLWAFCREALRLDRTQTRRAILVHQGVTYALVLAYICIAVALWPRIVGQFS